MKSLGYNASDMMKVKTRFAPSPTGLMHIGGVRTALYAFLVAKKNKGVFSLRIEDTDRKRFVPGATEDIIKSLKWLGLAFDGEPIVQSEREDLYKKYAKELVKEGSAYESEGAIWFKVPQEGKIQHTDLIGNRKIEFDNRAEKDFVILKSDGFPTYHLAHVVDDHLMEINPVIRGDEWISSTPKHILLFKAFDWEVPSYAHLPLILGTDKSKLSKRHGARSVSEFRKEGYLPKTILNYMALLGWSPPSGKEILTIDEMVKDFDLKDVHDTPAIFDIKKLEWMNGVYIRNLSEGDLKKELIEYYKDDKLAISFINENSITIDMIIGLARTRMKTLKDFKDLILQPETPPQYSDKEKEIARELHGQLSSTKLWKSENILVVLKNIMEKEKVRMPIIYKILTGRETGLPLPQSLEILGKDRVCAKLKKLV